MVVVAPADGDYSTIADALAGTTGNITIILLQGTYIGMLSIIATSRKVSIFRCRQRQLHSKKY